MTCSSGADLFWHTLPHPAFHFVKADVAEPRSVLAARVTTGRNLLRWFTWLQSPGSQPARQSAGT